MRDFKSSVQSLYSPTFCAHFSRESTLLPRTLPVPTCATLPSLLQPHLPALPLAAHLHPTPLLTLHASLAAALRTAPSTYPALLSALTAPATHDHLRAPLLALLFFWPSEPSLRPDLRAALAKQPAPALVVLVVRHASRQDHAALARVRPDLETQLGPDNVLLLVLAHPDHHHPHAPPAVANAIQTRLRRRADHLAEQAVRAAAAARKAARPSFRSWFASAAPAPAPAPAGGPAAAPALSPEGAAPDPASRTAAPPLPDGSVEALSRRAADLCMLARRFDDAAELYRATAAELRALAGPALVHEAAAWEMFALATALADGSKQAVGAALERAVKVYCAAGRKELAVRAALRAVQFCNEAGFPDSAAGVIVRAVEVIQPPKHVVIGAAAGGGAFVEGALAVLYEACGEAYAKLGKRRRASLYAFLAGSKFAKLGFYAAAAKAVRDVDDKAMLRTGVRDDAELILGKAELVEGRHARAVAHFVSVMSDAHEHKDVEVQGSAVRGFLDAAAKGARETMAKWWDTGAMFPLVEVNLTRVTTYDSNGGGDSAWKALEDDVLEDHEFFTAAANKAEDATIPKRERRIETVIAELRKSKEQGDSKDPGGSLEMKIRRMRELADARKKRRRGNSLLDRGAVVGEKISTHVSFRNPLHFPVFLDDLSAVVVMDGQIYSSQTHDDNDDHGNGEGETKEDPIEFVPTDEVTLVPCSSQRITVNVVSRKPGKLRLLGLSWNFTVGMGGALPKANASKVPGFCLLERRGRRLNATRQQRASEVPLYEKDESLLITVAPSAPRVKASVLSGADGKVDSRLESLTLRAGETRQATLLLRNEGTVPLKDIVMRIGTPQTFFLSMMPDRIRGDSSAAVFAIGMDDHAVQQDELVAAARLSICLQPNESKSMPVWLRAAVPNSAFANRTGMGGSRRGGRGNKRISEMEEDTDGLLLCDVRIAVAYGNEKIRVSRVKAQFKVQPSILVSPRFLREADEEVVCGGEVRYHGVLLGLEVEHGGHSLVENLIFDVTELSVTSRRGWKAMLLQEPTEFKDEAKDEISQSATSLRINETATVFFLVVRERDFVISSEKDLGSTEKLWHTFSVELLRQGPGRERCIAGIDQTSPRPTAVKDRDLEQRASTHFVLCANHGNSTSAAIAKQGNPELVYVSVGWKSSSGVSGEIHIPPIDPLRWMSKSVVSRSVSESTGKANSIGDESAHTLEVVSGEPLKQVTVSPEPLSNPREKWLDVRIGHPAALEHDFFNAMDRNAYMPEGSVAIPIPAVVPVDVFIRNVSPYLLDVVFAAPSEGGIADGDRGRFWAGDVAMSLRALPPGAERILSLTAVLVSPGRYNMSKLAVLFQTCGYLPARVRQQVTLEPSYLILAAKGHSKLMDGEHESLTLPVPNAQETGERTGSQTQSAEADESEATHVDDDKTVPVNGNGIDNVVEHRDEAKHQDKRMKSDSPTSTADIKDTVVVRKTRSSPRKSVARFGSPRSKSQPAPPRRKSFPRARSDGAAAKIFRGSADDALWNASDTDESEE